ncbi:hypothetical protein [Vreelandella sp. TE19]
MSQELSRHKACEEPKLYIQVLGTNHPDAHRFVFYDEQDEQEISALTEAVEEEDLPDPLSRIHSWEWEDEPTRNVWLEINSSEGGPIRVPLFNGVNETPWQESEYTTAYQHYVVQPVVPLAFWESLIDDAHHAMPCRSGFLYISYRSSLWREIEVAITDDDEWLFRDVNLAQYRDGSGIFTEENQRPATGQELKEIWLPARQAMGWLSSAVKVAFSDVQWSAARLNRLEEDADALNQRFQSVSLHRPEERVSRGRLLLPEVLPEQRARTPCLEYQIAHPPLWVNDLAGNDVSAVYQEALSEQQSLAEGGSDAVNNAWGINRENSPLRYDVGLRASAVEVVNQQYRGERAPDGSETVEGDTANAEAWEGLPSGTDVLADARERSIPGLVIDDPLFELRHAMSQMQFAQGYLASLLERCAVHPHYRSALLIQKRVIPENIGGESNPNHDFASEEELSYLGGLFHTCVATLARDIAHRCWEFHQSRLASLIGNATYQQALVDYFSLEGVDYLSGFSFSEQCLTLLSMDRKRVDTLYEESMTTLFQTPNRDNAPQTVVSIMEEGSSQLLHAMCFPETEAHPVEKPFVLPEDETNDGTGKFRPKALSDLNGLGEEALEDSQTVEVSLLAASARFDAIGELNRWSGAMDNVFGRIAESGKQALSQVADKSEMISMNARMYMPAFNAARGALYTQLGDLTLDALGNKDLNGYVVVGVEDVQSGLKFGLDDAERDYIGRNNHKRFYGQIYRTSDGTLLGGTNKARIESLKDVGEAREMRFVFAPADSKAAEYIRTGRRRIGFAERAISRVKLPYILLIFQGFNLSHASFSLDSEMGFKDGLSLVNAQLDLGLATLNLSDYIARRHQAPQAIAGVSKFSQKVLWRSGQTNFITALFPKLIRVNWLASKGAGVLSVTAMLVEATERYQYGDNDAAIAFGFATAGAVMTVLAFSGPVGWVGLALLVSGAVIGTLLTDGPFVQWLKNGPFGAQREAAPWLLEPEEAYYRLQSLLADISISARRLTPQEQAALRADVAMTHNRPNPSSILMGELWQRQLQASSVNTVIEVQSALPGMGIELQDVAVIGLFESQVSDADLGSNTRPVNVIPTLTQLSANKINYYIHTPENHLSGLVFIRYGLEVSIQFRKSVHVPFEVDEFYPAPEPLDEMPRGLDNVFNRESLNKDYWKTESIYV